MLLVLVTMKNQRIFFLTFTITLFVSVVAWSRETHFRLRNFSEDDIITTVVTGFDSFDFEKNNGPQDKLQNLSIPTNSSVKYQIEVNHFASNCPFTMTLWFSDLTSDWFRINQKFAIKMAKPDFSHSGNRTISFSRKGKTLTVTVKDKE